MLLLVSLGQLLDVERLVVFESFVLFIVLLLVVMDVLEILLPSVVFFLETLLLKLGVDSVLVPLLIQLSLPVALLLLQYADYVLLSGRFLILLHLLLHFLPLFECLELLLHRFVLSVPILPSCCSDPVVLCQTLDCFGFDALSQLCNPSFL